MARSLIPSSTNLPDDEPEIDLEDSTSGEEDSDSSKKTASQGDGSDAADSANTFPSPTASAFVVKPNSKSEVKSKKRAAADESEEVRMKKPKNRGYVAIAVSEKELVAKEDKAKWISTPGRLWCPEDELIILQGMLDYKKEKGVHPGSNLDAFHAYIKGSLNVVADRRQLSSKIRKLREKYQANALNEADGESLLSSFKGHEAKVYEHSKKICGHKAEAVPSQGSLATKIKLKSKKEVVPAETDSGVLALPVPEPEVTSKVVNGGRAKVSSRVLKVAQKMDLGEADHEMKESTISMPVMLDSSVIERGLKFVERSRLDALNEKWTKYQLDAAELYVKRLELVREQTRLILEAMKSNS